MFNLKPQQNISGKIFLYPHPTFTFKDKPKMLTSEKLLLEKIYYWNNREYNLNGISLEDTKWVTCWFCDPNDKYEYYDECNWKDVKSDWTRYINELNKDYNGPWRFTGWSLPINYIPTWIFDNKKEGDFVTIKIPIRANDTRFDIEESIMIETMIKANLKLAQLDSHYDYLGKFEEAIIKMQDNKL